MAAAASGARLSSVSLQPPHLRRRRSAAFCGTLLLVAALLTGLAGCANPGVPRPPSLHLAKPVADLTAIRIGDHVDLRWTAPDHTTDGLDFAPPSTVEICRDPALLPASNRPAAPEPSCTVVNHLPGHPGISIATDPLPPAVTTAPGSPLAYRIRVLNARGRGAAPSNAALIPSGPGLPPIKNFHASQTRRGVLLEWQRSADPNPSSPSEIEVLRILQPGSTLNAPHPRNSATPPRPGKPAPPLTPKTPVQVRLRATSPTGPDPGGMLDTTAQLHQTYIYTAERVRILPSPPSGNQKLELRSESTAPIAVARLDTIPPEPPRGLVSVPGIQSGGTGPHPVATIDLSWQPNPETDLAGYLIFRTDLSAPGPSQPRQLNPSPIPAPAFRDADLQPSHRYRYTVVAVDQASNQSPPSEAIEDSPQLP